MSWHFLQGGVGACWAPGSSGGPPSALSSLLSIQEASCLLASGTDSLTSSPSGTTSRPLTRSRGEASLTLLRGGSPASPSPPPLEDATTQRTCGPKCEGSSASATLGLSLQRTCSGSPSSVPPPTFIDSGIDAATRRSRQPTWVPRTPDNDGGSLPTPTATANADADSMQKHPAHRRYRLWSGGRTTPTLWEFLMGWPLGWTDLEPLVTDKCHVWLRLHGDYFTSSP